MSCFAANISAAPKKLRSSILDRKSTRLNSSHQIISYAVFCLKKKTEQQDFWVFSGSVDHYFLTKDQITFRYFFYHFNRYAVFHAITILTYSYGTTINSQHYLG